MDKICDYGCGQDATHQFKNKKWCCSNNASKCPAIKVNLGSGGYDYNLLSEETKLKMSRKGQVFFSEKDIFVNGKEWGSEFLRKYIHHYKILDYKCAGIRGPCNLTDWYGEHLVLDLDHINGKRDDNRKDNLRWLCPNCHSQTDTFRGRNKNPGKQKVSDEALLTALKNHSNIRQALQSVGLAAKGGNYERASKLAKQLSPGGEMVYTGDLEKI